MAFRPPYCPHPDCSAHRPGARFRWRRHGTYRRRCDGRVVPRFLCLECGRSCSSQTFRVDYRLRLPRLHLAVFDLLASKVTLRQASRVLGIQRRTIEHRLELLGRHCRDLHRAALARIAARGGLHGTFVLDELETFEHDRHLRPLTVPVLVHSPSGFVLHAGVAPLPTRRPVPPRKRAALRRMERAEGRRRSGSRRAVERAFEVLDRVLASAPGSLVVTDEKVSYPGALRRKVRRPIAHERVSSRRVRSRANPLFPVNLTFAMVRDGASRLVRRSWAVSKRARRLELHLWVWIAFRNWVREWRVRPAGARRTSAAARIGLAAGRVRKQDLLRWRVHPALTL